MRSNEQFKAYVYEKADAARIKNKKLRAIMLRGVAVFSLFVVVGGIMLYDNATEKAMMSPESIAEDGALLSGKTAAEMYLYSAMENEKTDVAMQQNADAVYDVCYSAQGSVAYSSTVRYAVFTVAESADAYKGDLSEIDFTTNVALVLEDCGSITEYKVEYAENAIVVTVTIVDAMEETASTYTILLDKAKYNGQPIEVVYQ